MWNQLRFLLPNLVPKTFTRFPKEKDPYRRSVLDDEAKAILSQWGWVDKKIYEEAKVLYEEKQNFAKICSGESTTTSTTSSDDST